jgi:hypothetical protein
LPCVALRTWCPGLSCFSEGDTIGNSLWQPPMMKATAETEISQASHLDSPFI